MLVDKKVLVVGGSSGIGLAVARAASAQGASVTIASRSQDKLRAAAESIDGAVDTMVVDATDPKSVQEMFGALGTIDHLAVTTHDSGKALSRTMLPLADIDLEQAEIYFRSRFWAKVICTKYAIPPFVGDGIDCAHVRSSSARIYRTPLHTRRKQCRCGSFCS